MERIIFNNKKILVPLVSNFYEIYIYIFLINIKYERRDYWIVLLNE